MRFVVSDLHGCLYSLQALIAEINKLCSNPHLIFVGDFVDRGKHSKQVIDFVLSLENCSFVLGNHDDVIAYLSCGQYVSFPSEWVTFPANNEKIVRWWARHGLIETCSSYGIDIKARNLANGPVCDEIVEQIKSSIPYEHKTFLANLPLFYEDDDCFVMHGFLDPKIELPRNMKFLKLDCNECLWGRFGGDWILNKRECKWDKIGIFGHSPVHIYGHEKPIASDKIRLIDTCCFQGTGLSAYCVDTDEFITVESDSRDVCEIWRTNKL